MSNISTAPSLSFYYHVVGVPASILYTIGMLYIMTYCMLLTCINKDIASMLICAVSKIVFSRLEVSTDKDGKITYSLFGCPITTLIQYLLFVISGNILILAATVALRVCLLDESFTCDSGFDCFDANGSYIEDCNDFDGERVRCYKLVLRLDLAIGAMGGILALALTLTTFYGDVTLPIVKILINKYGRKGLCLGRIYIVFCTIVIFAIIHAVLVILIFPVARETETTTINVYIGITIHVSIWGTLYIVVWCAKQMFLKDQVADKDKLNSCKYFLDL